MDNSLKERLWTISQAFGMFILVLALYKLFHTKAVDSYANINLYLNYDYGVCKRALAGEIYRIINSLFFDNELSSHVYLLTLHKYLICIFALGVSATYCLCASVKNINKLLLFTIFFTLICSYFVKNLINLNGYLDLYVMTLLVWVIFFIIRKQLFLVCILSFVAGCFHEETIFFLIPIMLFELLWESDKKFQKNLIICLIIPVVISAIVAFNPFNAQNIASTSDNNSRLTAILGNVLSQYNEQQTSIASLVLNLISKIHHYYDNIILSHIFLVLPNFCLFVYLFRKFYCYKNFSKFKILMTFICFCFSEILLLLAIDLWRMVSFLNFSFWIMSVLTVNNSYLTYSNLSKFGIKDKICNCFIIIASSFYCLLPNVVIMYNDFSVGGYYNTAIYDKYLKDLLPYKFTENFAELYSFRNGDKDSAIYTPNYDGYWECGKEGGKIPLPQISPGKKLLTFNVLLKGEANVSSNPKIRIGTSVRTLKKSGDTSMLINVPREVALASGSYFVAECLPYEVNWTITKIIIIDASQIKFGDVADDQ